ncbi:hemagglutinin repeat-containing protein, partial [Hydrogenophaga sp. 5NK40-0174]|uniref:hemagglutinin repeat-containing protein n=1 Tax=Hydrogenophaga sp. 5NK40-0174 TaxID=3127649 RepID=UPI003341CC15
MRSFEYSHKYDTWGGTASTKVTRVSRDVDITNSGNTWNVGGGMNIVAGGDIDIVGAQVNSSGFNAQAGGNYAERAAYDVKE